MRTMMPEAEVSLRLAIYLLRQHLTCSAVEVAIDGAQIRTGIVEHFAIAEFMRIEGCFLEHGTEGWQGSYSVADCDYPILIHSSPGRGDVIAELTDGSTLRVESKKGPLARSKSSAEYPLLRQALGQLITISKVGPHERLAVAVPYSPKFKELAERWANAPLIQLLGISFLLVDPSGQVSGLKVGPNNSAPE